MATVADPSPPLPVAAFVASLGGVVVLPGVSWKRYCQLRDAPGNDAVRMTYLDWELTLMSPALRHDVPGELLTLLVRGVTAGLGLEVMGIRTTTLRRGPISGQSGVGKEPDAAFYLGANERRMRNRRELDLAVDPPPDLAIEVDHTQDSMSAMAVYAQLGVPEVWRYMEGHRRLTFHVLAGGTYRQVERSVALPRLTPTLVLAALDHRVKNDLGQNEWFEWLKGWARALPEPPPAA